MSNPAAAGRKHPFSRRVCGVGAAAFSLSLPLIKISYLEFFMKVILLGFDSTFLLFALIFLELFAHILGSVNM